MTESLPAEIRSRRRDGERGWGVCAVIRSREPLLLGLAGAFASSVAVVAGGQSNTANTVPPTEWFELLSPGGYRPGSPWGFGVLLWFGVAGLVALWLRVIGLNDCGTFTTRQIWWLACSWSAPLVAGPPLISKDVYAYAAHGLMLRSGIDVYESGVSALAHVGTSAAARALSAVDPIWRNVGSPYGPLATLIERMSAEISGGNSVGALIVLRAISVLSVFVAARLAAELAGPRRTDGLVLIALNPLVLVQAVSAIHFESEICALLLAGLVAVQRGHWGRAVFLTCAAGAIKAPALAAMLPLLAFHGVHVRRRGLPRGLVARTVAIDLAIATASFAAFTALVPNGLGWIRNLATPAHSRTTSAISGAVGSLARAILPSALSGDATAAAGVAGYVAAASVVVYLSATANVRPLAVTIGYALLGIAFLLPVFYPWYLLWGAVCLLPSAPGARRDWLIGLCAFESVAAIAGAPTEVTLTLNGLVVATGAVLLIRRARNRRGVRVDLSGIPSRQSST